MTENGDPYENALAERMNRTLKEEFSLNGTFFSYEQAKQLAAEAILYYNQKRPLASCNYLGRPLSIQSLDFKLFIKIIDPEYVINWHNSGFLFILRLPHVNINTCKILYFPRNPIFHQNGIFSRIQNLATSMIVSIGIA